MSRKVVVIGHGYTSRLGVIRALGRAGYEVIVIVMATYRRDGTLNTSKPIDCDSKYVSRVLYCPSDQNRLITTLLEECADPEQKVILFPDSDFSVAVIDENQELLRGKFEFPSINHQPGAIVTWMNKLRQKEVAKEVGLNVADGVIVDVKDGKYELPSGIEYPCFPKPLSTVVGGKRGLRRCNDERQLRQTLTCIISYYPDIKILVEEYKPIETEYALLGFTDGKEVFIPGIIKILSLAGGGHFGVAKQGMIMPVEGFEDLLELFKAFVLKTGFEGIFDIDFYNSGEEFYFCEMNFRYGGSGYAYTASDVNLPIIAVRHLIGEPYAAAMRYVSSASVFVNERMCRDDWMDGLISSGMFHKLLRSADISFIADDFDPEPEKVFKNSLKGFKKNSKRIVKRLLRRYR